MEYWINSETSSNNVAVIADRSIVVASCDEEDVDAVRQKLEAGRDYNLVFGSDNFTVVSFSQLELVRARSTDDEVELEYKAKKDHETVSPEFVDQESKNAFLAALEDQLPSSFKKRESQQSALAAAFPPFISFLVGASISMMYWNKLRWIVLIVGGAWLLFSAYMFYQRITNPPVITTLSSRNIVGSLWQKLKLTGSLALVMLIALAFSTQLSDSYGERALGDHIDADELTVSNLPKLLERGSDINSVSEYGWTVLHQAAYMDDEPLFALALANGADPFLDVEEMQTPLDYLIDYERADMLRTVLDSSWKPDELGHLIPRIISSTSDTQMMAVLFEAGLSPSDQDQEGNNALQLALINGSSFEMVSYLLEQGVPANVQIDGKSLADYAVDNGQEDVAQLFRGTPIDYAKDRELTKKIDEYFISKLKAQMENAPPIVKLLLKSEGGISDEDYREMIDEATGSHQYRSMVAWGNQRVLATYADLCSDSSFDNAAELRQRTNKHADLNSGDIQIADLIFERNRPVYVEAKDEFVVPQEIKQKYTAAETKLKTQYLSNDVGSGSGLLKKCSEVLKRLKKQQTAT